jgi:hypothetical protein
MTEINVLCREYEFRGSVEIGRWFPIGKIILRLKVDDGEWAFQKDLIRERITEALKLFHKDGIKYEIVKMFKLPYDSRDIQTEYDSLFYKSNQKNEEVE